MLTTRLLRRLLLSIVVIVFGLDIGFHWIRTVMYEADQGSAITESVRKHSNIPESARNERSTPRSFILPATPAVALEQEMRSTTDSAIALTNRQMAICAMRLRDFGYDVGDEAVAFNAKLAEATYEYQEAHGLNKTGKLDTSTIRSLSCKVN